MRQKMRRATKWCAFEAKDFAENLMRDFKSLRALLNYIIMALFIWVIVHLVLHNAETCGNTIVTVLGAVISGMFTNYVWSAHAEKKLSNRVPAFEQKTEVEIVDDKAEADGASPDSPVLSPEQPAGASNG